MPGRFFNAENDIIIIFPHNSKLPDKCRTQEKIPRNIFNVELTIMQGASEKKNF